MHAQCRQAFGLPPSAPRNPAGLARFIAGLDPDIPYSLLAFCPQFYLHDLPMTSRDHAEEALRVARLAGLRRVRIGNRHLLGPPYGGGIGVL